MVVDRMAPRWIGTPGPYPFVSHRRGSAFPRILLLGRNPEIDIVASHRRLLALDLSVFI
jgi:hypothetical protein